MKKITPIITLAIIASLYAPIEANALSCLDPAGMIDYIVNDDTSVVVTAKPIEQSEFVLEERQENDANAQFDSGYTGQLLAVEELHKGYIDEQVWVYYEKNPTWGYLCAGAPGELGASQVYVLNQAEHVADLPTVTLSYQLSSDLAEELLQKIERRGEDVFIQPVFTIEDRINRLVTDIKELIFIGRIKLAELLFWQQ